MGVPSMLIETGKCPLGTELGEPVEGGRVLFQEVPSPASSSPLGGGGRGDQDQAGPLGLLGLSRRARQWPWTVTQEGQTQNLQ